MPGLDVGVPDRHRALLSALDQRGLRGADVLAVHRARWSVDVTSIDMAPTALIDSTVVVATTTSPACSGREWLKLCSPCTTIE